MAVSPKTDRQKADAEHETRIGMRMAGIGFQVATEVVAGVLLGLLFDWWRGSGRTGVMVGSIVGIAVAIWSLLKNTLKLNKELDRKSPTTGRGKPLGSDEPFRESDRDPENDDDDDWNKDK